MRTRLNVFIALLYLNIRQYSSDLDNFLSFRLLLNLFPFLNIYEIIMSSGGRQQETIRNHYFFSGKFYQISILRDFKKIFGKFSGLFGKTKIRNLGKFLGKLIGGTMSISILYPRFFSGGTFAGLISNKNGFSTHWMLFVSTHWMQTRTEFSAFTGLK